ncbi:hypothetical protein Tco_0549519 [Tanacetum coccineum]
MYETLYQAWEMYNDLLFKCPQHDLSNHQKVRIFYTGLDIFTRKLLDSRGFITLMTPTQALKSIQVMVDHSHNWYDETTTKEKINDNSDNIDDIQESFKEAHLTKECPLKKEDKAAEQMQPYMPLGPVYDKEKIVREEEQDYDIPLHDGVMQPLTPYTVHITPLDDDYVTPATSPTLDKQLNEFEEECSDITRVADKANGNPVKDVQELSDIKTYDYETFIRKLLHQVSQSSHKTGKTKREIKSHQRFQQLGGKFRDCLDLYLCGNNADIAAVMA